MRPKALLTARSLRLGPTNYLPDHPGRSMEVQDEMSPVLARDSHLMCQLPFQPGHMYVRALLEGPRAVEVPCCKV
jgi:hypothetical protein